VIQAQDKVQWSLHSSQTIMVADRDDESDARAEAGSGLEGSVLSGWFRAPDNKRQI
jgi:hypothetical protein